MIAGCASLTPCALLLRRLETARDGTRTGGASGQRVPHRRRRERADVQMMRRPWAVRAVLGPHQCPGGGVAASGAADGPQSRRGHRRPRVGRSLAAHRVIQDSPDAAEHERLHLLVAQGSDGVVVAPIEPVAPTSAGFAVGRRRPGARIINGPMAERASRGAAPGAHELIHVRSSSWRGEKDAPTMGSRKAWRDVAFQAEGRMGRLAERLARGARRRALAVGVAQLRARYGQLGSPGVTLAAAARGPTGRLYMTSCGGLPRVQRARA